MDLAPFVAYPPFGAGILNVRFEIEFTLLPMNLRMRNSQLAVPLLRENVGSDGVRIATTKSSDIYKKRIPDNCEVESLFSFICHKKLV